MIGKKDFKKILVEPGYIEESQYGLALEKSAGDVAGIWNFLVEKDFLQDEQIGFLVANFIGRPFVDLSREKIEVKALELLPEADAKKFGVIFFAENKNTIKAAFSNPADKELLHNLEKKTGKNIEVYFATEAGINEALLFYKKNLKEALEDLIAQKENQNSLYSRMVDTLLEQAYFHKASDLHIEPGKKYITFRFRMDGVMHEMARLPKKHLEQIVSRIKILSRLRTDEHFAAQDGSFQMNIGNETIDMRVSILPVTSGEKVVMRILASGNRKKKLSSLGFSEEDLKKINASIASPHGMVLVVGPTGSGKTTTIYEIVKTLNSEKVNISSIEDPVEYDIEMVNQIQVNKKTHLDFASGLRAIVRQDPDIILVGEIRDGETAEIAVNSAMTGHLVLSTMHANDASTTLPRLKDLGVEDFLLASTINIIIAQRLVRRLCLKCRSSYKIGSEEKDIIKKNKSLSDYLKQKNKKISSVVFYKAKGCKMCAGTGYKDRLGVFEILEINTEIKDLIAQKSSSQQIKQEARKKGMKSMLEDGFEKVLQGQTSLEELLRVARD